MPVALLVLAAAAGALPETVLVADPVALNPDVADRIVVKTNELFRHALQHVGAKFPAPEIIDRLRKGAVGPAPLDLSAARKALEDGRNAYLFFELDIAIDRLKGAQDAFAKVMAQTGDFDAYAESVIYLGAAWLGKNNKKAARRAFLDLLTRRPGYPIDAGVFPPKIVDAFDAARTTAKKTPTITLSISSAPPLATVTLDGSRRGETPVSVPNVPVGRHALRVEAPGHRPWWKMVDVTATSTELQVRLEAGGAGDDLRGLATEAGGNGGYKLMAGQAASVARQINVGGVAILAMAKIDNLLVTAALVDADGQVRSAWTMIDPDLLRAQEAMRKLVGALGTAAQGQRVDIGLPAPDITPDFQHRLLGFVAADFVVETQAQIVDAGPFYSRWWFWTGVAIVVGGAAGATAWAVSNREQRVEQQPDIFTVGISAP